MSPTSVRRRLLVGLLTALGAVPAAVVGGGLPPTLAAAGGDRGPEPSRVERLADANPAGRAHGQLMLRLRQVAALESVAHDVSTPGSPRFKHPLGSSELAAGFNPTAATTARVREFLQRYGLVVTAERGMLVDFEGPNRAVAAAFHASLGAYRERSTGARFEAPDEGLQVPVELAPEVVGVFGLDTQPTHRPHLRRLSPSVSALPDGAALSPQRVRSAYHLTGGILSGATGAGQTIGLLELDAYVPAHLAAYDATYYYQAGRFAPGALPAPTVVPVDGGATDNTIGGQEEVDLDLELIRAVAPEAQVRVYLAPNTNPGVNDAYTQMVNDGVTVVSTSWGECEPLQDQSTNPQGAETAALRQVFLGAAARGVTTFAASGDTGAYDCRNPGDTNDALGNPLHDRVAVDSPASDPNVVGVGAMSAVFVGDSWAHDVNHPLSAWNTPGSASPMGSGGGMSADNPAPAWQAGPGVAIPGLSNGARQVPDVAVAGDPASDPYAIYTAGATGPGWMGIAGTSAGPPIWSGFMALYRQARPSAPANAASAFYSAAQCPLGFTPYDDVTAGNNQVFSATPGWDAATGWGSLRGDEMAATLLAEGSAPLGVRAVAPTSGPAGGGTPVAIVGCGFGSGTSVTFGGEEAATVTVVSPTLLRVSTPPHPAGAVTMVVHNPGGAFATGAEGFSFNEGTLVGATGRDGSAHLLRGSTITNLGGSLLGAPVVAGNAAAPIVVATGIDHNLYVRGVDPAVGWQLLTPGRTYCDDSPAAAVVSGRLWVACAGGDQALWYASIPYSSGLPSIPGFAWKSLGGRLAAGPALAGQPGTDMPVFAVTGIDQHVYMRTLTTDYTGFSWRCIGRPALAATASSTTFACHGTDGQLWWSAMSGGAWADVSSLGGQLVDGPGVSAVAGATRFFAEGTDRQVWENSGSGWHADGDQVRSGATAVAL